MGARAAARSRLISWRVKEINAGPWASSGGGSVAAMTDKKAWARIARAVQRCQEVQVRTWCWSRAASSLPAAKDSSIVQRRPATLTRAESGAGVGV
jgi:hypothetical protein